MYFVMEVKWNKVFSEIYEYMSRSKVAIIALSETSVWWSNQITNFVLHVITYTCPNLKNTIYVPLLFIEQ